MFAHYVSDPERYGVISFSEEGLPLEIYEKPSEYISVTALDAYCIVFESFPIAGLNKTGV